MKPTRWLSVLVLCVGAGCVEAPNAEPGAPRMAHSGFGAGETGGSSGTDGAPDLPAVVGRIELAHLSEERPAWTEIRTLQSALTAKQAWETVSVAPNEVVAAVLRSAEGEILDAQFVSTECSYDLTREPVTLTVPTDYETIQAAIDAAAPRDTVRVLAGTYHEHLRLRRGVRLIGAGARETILEGDGKATNLIDFTDASDVVITGFTLRNVGQGEGCARPDDPLACSGNWYASAIYADGHAFADKDPCNDPSIYVSGNIVTGNDIGMMLYFHPYAVVRDNVFVANRVGFAANHHGGGSTLLTNNTFYRNQAEAVAVSASFLDVVNNVFLENGMALRQEYCQRGRLRCNVLWNNQSIGDRGFSDSDGNIFADPLLSASDYSLAEDSPALHTACVNEPEPAPTMQDPDGHGCQAAQSP